MCELDQYELSCDLYTIRRNKAKTNVASATGWDVLLDPSRPLFAEIHGCARDLSQCYSFCFDFSTERLNGLIISNWQWQILWSSVRAPIDCMFCLCDTCCNHLRPSSILRSGLWWLDNDCKWQRTWFTVREIYQKSDCFKLGTGTEAYPTVQTP